MLRGLPEGSNTTVAVLRVVVLSSCRNSAAVAPAIHISAPISGRRVGVSLSRVGCPPVRPQMWELLRDRDEGTFSRPGISPRPVGLPSSSSTPFKCK
jgi:hypothetical protein